MRIAQVAPLFESVPPRKYGGTERVVSYLTEELVRQGHEVTLFASGDSVTEAQLVSPCRAALRLRGADVEHLPYHVAELEAVVGRAARFDVIHFHTDVLSFPFIRRLRTPSLTTLHGRLDLPELQGFYRPYRDIPVVSISDAQRAPLPWLNWAGTVHHGVPHHEYQWEARVGRYLVVVGRISPEKGVDDAIEIATRVGLPLRIAAKVDRSDRDYFDSVIRPLLRRPGIEFLGEATESEKRDLLRGALALLFPIRWPEPFGLVMIEAMACGTPVVAFRGGSVPEVITPGVTGMVVTTVDQAVAAVERVALFDRAGVRRELERRFGVTRAARDYLALYRQLTIPRRPARAGRGSLAGEPEQVA